MSAQQDLQELLRLLTVGRKTPMLQAMAQIKSLQAVEIRSIQQIAEAPRDTIKTALNNDEKTAKSLQNACKAAMKRTTTSTAAGPAGTKRGAPSLTANSPSKRLRHDGNPLMPSRLPGKELTPQELEASLELPLCLDEELISQTDLETNRAPLVLAFAIELLRYTRPEQPLSSRLSLGQAVVSANSRSKAVSIGIAAKGSNPEDEGLIGSGQPRVKVMGREVPVLKRGGYEWREASPSQTLREDQNTTATAQSLSTESKETQPQPQPKTHPFFHPQPSASNIHWSSSGAPLTFKDSRFLAHSTRLTSPSQEKILLNNLFRTRPNLESATHNAWAYRVRLPSNPTRITEKSFDDGEQGAGEFMLRILREMSIDDTLVVMTRWYGGTMLGPDRWRLMKAVVSSALNERSRVTTTSAQNLEEEGGGVKEAVWGLDLDIESVSKPSTSSASTSAGDRKASYGTGVIGMQIHKPEQARNYLLRSFHTASPATTSPSVLPGSGSPEGTGQKKKIQIRKTQKQLEAEREQNLGLLLGALRLLFDSWKDHLPPAELDKRAWAWYTAVRPDVEAGPGGWGAKGRLELGRILELRRRKKEDKND